MAMLLRSIRTLTLVLAPVVAACSTGPAGRMDGGNVDVASTEAGRDDAGGSDGGGVDASSIDAAGADSGGVDGGGTDSARADSATGDSATVDSGTSPDGATPPPTDEPIGWAAMDGMTTGGAGGATVTVRTLAELRAAAGASMPTIILVSGTITGTGSVVVRSNKSIIGLPGATLDGVGLRLYGTSTSDYVRNIIIRNLRIRSVIATDPATGGGDNDAIGLKYADHVWVDHCDLSADLMHSDWEYYDGLVDISRQSDHVTVSWTRFSNSFKGSGVGGSSDAGLGRLRVTYHHNWFESIGERAPGYGYGTGHVFSNYFSNSATASGYAVGSRFGATLRVEHNFFRNIRNPIRTEIDSVHGYVSGASTNRYESSGAVSITTTSDYMPPYEYASSITPAADVPAVVMAGSGPR